MISYDLSKRGDLPRYQYLYTRIREDITNGRLRPDERMPSKRRFAEVLNVSVNTVMTAYDLLVAEGLLVFDAVDQHPLDLKLPVDGQGL